MTSVLSRPHLLSMKQLEAEQIFHLFDLADQMKNNLYLPMSRQTFAANVFLEPSTRTKMSFQVAERKLGLETMNLDGESSSFTKGESLYDTLKTLEAIGVEVAVVRQSEIGLLDECKDLNLSLINAGDGCGEHPTQSLLDLYTIYEHFHSFHGLKVAIAGDLKHSRVARSNAHALEKLGAHVSFVTPPDWQDPSLTDEYVTMDEAVEQCDVIMLLRIQHERHLHSTSQMDYLENYGLTKEREARMHPNAIILHPAPVNRGVEIDSDLVESPKSRIFRQMTNGVTIRMAIIEALLKGEL
ncbi:aspartate carbamoyltransferase catalytic subunit [Halobacillus litoralis]|uniref:aspartate carbamoyltransferase catalytic subunit n=1 Tax=Halobacillus litoralis TaxID=45668 RepID=UPI001CD2E7B5|nr:aspartate carbamoyltransferase catalytic subunit [Halobacillus litoralis]MCA0969346.1 aspartate carbamoyltransferase catalytic subunit [Halobacillus litoralis]